MIQQHLYSAAVFSLNSEINDKNCIMSGSSFMASTAVFWKHAVVQSMCAPTTQDTLCKIVKNNCVPEEYFNKLATYITG